jgi:hypothetical protein
VLRDSYWACHPRPMGQLLLAGGFMRIGRVLVRLLRLLMSLFGLLSRRLVIALFMLFCCVAMEL